MRHCVQRVLIEQLNLNDSDAEIVSDAIIQCIVTELERNPLEIDHIMPGYKLALRKMTPKERAGVILPAANRVRSENKRRRVDEIKPIIEHIVASEPAISLRRLADALDQSGIKPPRAKSWSLSSVKALLKEIGNNDDGSSKT